MLLNFIPSSNSLRLQRYQSCNPERVFLSEARLIRHSLGSLGWSEDVCDLDSTCSSSRVTKTPKITTETSTVKSEGKMLRCNQLKSSALCDKEGQIGWVCLWMEGDDSISSTASCSSFSPITADGRAAPLLGRDRGGGNAHSRVKEELELWERVTSDRRMERNTVKLMECIDQVNRSK